MEVGLGAAQPTVAALAPLAVIAAGSAGYAPSAAQGGARQRGAVVRSRGCGGMVSPVDLLSPRAGGAARAGEQRSRADAVGRGGEDQLRAEAGVALDEGRQPVIWVGLGLGLGVRG